MKKSDDGHTVGYWEQSRPLVEKQSLSSSIVTDVCIIGGGIAGLSTAYRLSQAGRDVVVIDDGLMGGGTTGRTTAHLASAIDDRIYQIVKWHGEEKAKLAVQAHSAAIDEIERIVLEENIACDFARLDGYLFQDPEADKDVLQQEFEAAQKIMPVEWVDRAPLTHSDTGKCLRFPNQGQIHILKYLNGLIEKIERHGGRLYSHTRAVEWQGGESPQVTTEKSQTIRANSIVLATNYPIFSKMFAKLPAYRSYVIAAKIPKDSVARCLIWDTADPYHYVRTQAETDYDVLIVGGEDHRTGQQDDGIERFQKLWQWTRQRFPQAQEILAQWSSQLFETHDGLAFIGRYSGSEPNVYLITGDSGHGITHGTIGAMMISDFILGKENVWEDVFRPSRILSQSVAEAVPEIVSSSLPYVDWITSGDVSSPEEVAAGTGAIIRQGLKKIAVYRDENGVLYQRSAVCTHLGCIVRFNSLEKTWDCPCHGSRFAVDGSPINTPAVKPLGELSD